MAKPHLSIPGSGFVLVLVLNEMVLVLVIESLVHSIASTVLLTKHVYDMGAQECG